jgi:hypothetical protein
LPTTLTKAKLLAFSSLEIKNPQKRGFFNVGGEGGIRPRAAGRGLVCKPNPSNPSRKPNCWLSLLLK